jgi:hypothetical protein
MIQIDVSTCYQKRKMYTILVKCILGSSGYRHCRRWVRLTMSLETQEQAERTIKRYYILNLCFLQRRRALHVGIDKCCDQHVSFVRKRKEEEPGLYRMLS